MLDLLLDDYYGSHLQKFDFRRNFKSGSIDVDSEPYSLSVSGSGHQTISAFSQTHNLTANRLCRLVVEKLIKKCESKSGHFKFQLDSILALFEDLYVI